MNTKNNEKKKEIEKADRDGKKVTFSENKPEDEKKMTLEEQIYKKRIDEKLNIS